MRNYSNLLSTLRTSNAPAILMILMACVLLGDQLFPTAVVDGRDPLELTEVQEESESKKETEKEKEMEDTDEFLHSIHVHRFATHVLSIGRHTGFEKQSVRVSVSETPPPELV